MKHGHRGEVKAEMVEDLFQRSGTGTRGRTKALGGAENGFLWWGGI
jgi:hypothetical protein